MHAHRFDIDGFALLPGVLADGDCDRLLAHAVDLDPASAGSRCLLAQPWCRALVAQVRAHPQLAALLPAEHVAVQCTYFEKSRERNWLVPIHQDLSIPVAERIAHPLLRGWSEKEGSLYVQPPAELLEDLIAVRLHLDPCGLDDGPLQFVAGTHRQGRIDAATAASLRRGGTLVTCTAARGDALVMRPLALHASSKARGSSLRRVLHLVFGPARLPFGLRWQQPLAATLPDTHADGNGLHSRVVSFET